MILQTQTSQNCVVYAVAMAMDLPAAEVIAGIGHDGTTPYKQLRYRGVHMDEVQTYALSRGHHFYPITPYPCIVHEGVERVIYDHEEAEDRITRLLEGTKGIMEGYNHNKVGHTVAYECNKGAITLYDPAGRVINLLETKYIIKTVWVYV